MSTSTGATALRRLASMPFLDRLELAAAAGLSDRSAYRAVAALERRGLVRSLLHGTELLRTTRRYHLAAAGLERLAALDEQPVDALLRARPVSAQWRRILLERLDAVAVVYRLAASIAALRGAIGFRWYRGLPMFAVGMPVTRHPPHRSVRALSGIRLLRRVRDGKSRLRPLVEDADRWPQAHAQGVETFPREAVHLEFAALPPSLC